jgi:subtilisin
VPKTNKGEETMAEDGTKSIIVTFKRKDKRADKKKDKAELVRAAVDREVTLLDTRTVTPDVMRSLDPAEIGYDVNEYEAPIVILRVTDKEAAALRKDPNVASVEEDGRMYALGLGHDTGALLFEDQPTVQAETVPAGINQIKAPLAWDATRGKGVKVAVLDTGIDYNHPDLAANYRGGVSFVPDE